MSDFLQEAYKSAETHEMRSLARSVADGWTFRNQLPLVAVGCMASVLLELEIQERTGLRAGDPDAILSR